MRRWAGRLCRGAMGSTASLENSAHFNALAKFTKPLAQADLVERSERKLHKSQAAAQDLRAWRPRPFGVPMFRRAAFRVRIAPIGGNRTTGPTASGSPTVGSHSVNTKSSGGALAPANSLQCFGCRPSQRVFRHLQNVAGQRIELICRSQPGAETRKILTAHSVDDRLGENAACCVTIGQKRTL